MTHSNDKRLVAALISGDEGAFNRFFDDQYPRVYRFALARSSDVHLAEEMAQSVLCTALEKLASYRGEASLTTWLFTICRNRLTDLARRKEVATPKDCATDDELAAALESLVDADPDPAAHAEQTELAAKIRLVLDHIPPQHAEVLRLKYTMELSMKQIASQMKTSAKAVESMLTRARQSFREAFVEVA